MPDPAAAFARWVRLLNTRGTVVLVEGRWGNGAGLRAVDAERIVRTVRSEASVRHLPESIHWGKEIEDERYLLVSRS